jgi:predicted P-loop ATPase
MRAKKWQVPAEIESVRYILVTDPRWAGRLAHDSLSYAPALDGKLLMDDDVDAIRAWLYRVYGIERLPKETALAGIIQAARGTTLDPVVSWLDGLSAWDGVDRLSTWLQEYAGAKGHDGLLGHYARGFFVSLVARQYDPIVQADNVLVLWGEQGIRKSSLLRAILPDREWFSDSRMDLEDPKRILASLGGKILVEWPELAALRKTDVEGVKAFLTSQYDRYVPMYSKLEVGRPRRVMFCASLNRNNSIPEVGRRWWVAEVTRRCDTAKMARDREQIFAQALSLYRGGAQWHLTPEYESLQLRDIERFAVPDEWVDRVRDMTRTPHERNDETGWILSDIAIRAVQLAKLSRPDELRLQNALRSCDWVRRDGRWYRH